MTAMHSKISPRFKRCEEFVVGSCNDDTEDCCAVIPCSLCLELTIYPDILYGFAPWIEESFQYYGTVTDPESGEHTFSAYWEKDYGTGDCQFVVEWDDEVVYTKGLCEYTDPITCRDPGDEVEVDVEYGVTGTLEWLVREMIEVRRVAEDGCTVPWCDDCLCACKKLCVTVAYTDYVDEENSCIAEGVFDFSGDQCTDGTATTVKWSGSATCESGKSWGGYIEMDVDSYGNCTISGELTTGDPTAVLDSQGMITNCSQVAAGWVIDEYDYDITVNISCLKCGDCSPVFSDNCCDERECPGFGGDNDMPSSLSISIAGPEFYMEGTATVSNCQTNLNGHKTLIAYSGILYGTFDWCDASGNPKTYEYWAGVTMQCSGGGEQGWIISFNSAGVDPTVNDCIGFELVDNLTANSYSCDPILIASEEFSVFCEGLAACPGGTLEFPDPVTHGPHEGLTFAAWEAPIGP